VHTQSTVHMTNTKCSIFNANPAFFTDLRCTRKWGRHDKVWLLIAAFSIWRRKLAMHNIQI